MRPFSRLRSLQEAHNAWLEALFTQARPAVDAAHRDLFRIRPDLASVAWTITGSARAGFSLVVTSVEFHRRDGTIIGAGDAVACPRRYRPLADLLIANAEILAATVLACTAQVVATRDGQLTVTTADP